MDDVDLAFAQGCGGAGLHMSIFAATDSAMPTYEYHCEKCGKDFEAFQSMRDEAFRTCPKELCRMSKWGKGKVKRLLGTGAGIIFKGSGFYITDYRKPGYTEAAKKEGGSSSGEAKEQKSSKPKESGAKSGASSATESKSKDSAA
jgi:putative FmdB family regulatory protein